MTSKTSYTLCSSSKNSQNLRSVSLDSNLTKKVYLARQKLISVIDDLMKTAKENPADKLGKSFYLTVEQYQDAIWASKILKEADEVLTNNKNDRCLKRPLNVDHINLENKNVKINKFGQIYIDTSILVEVIELQNALGEIVNNIHDTPSDVNSVNDVSSYIKTEYSDVVKKCDDDKANISVDKSNSIVNIQKKGYVDSSNENDGRKSQPTKIARKEMQKATTDDLLTSIIFPPEEEFLVMSTHTLKCTNPMCPKQESERKCPSQEKKCCVCAKKKLCPLSEERTSTSEINLGKCKCTLRKVKSTNLQGTNQKDLKVTDVAGARDIIVNCISDLDKIRTFFETNMVDVGVKAEFQIQKFLNSQSAAQSPTVPNSKHSVNRSQCSCGNVEGEGDDDSKIIICIKGQEESEKDVQIIIRKCSECKTEPCSDTTDLEQNKTESNSRCDPCDNPCDPCDLPRKVSSGIPCDTCKNPCDYPSSPATSADSLREKKSGLNNIVFKPDAPCKSAVEVPCANNGKDIATSVSAKPIASAGERYDRIKLCETTNLCLSTDNGQDLIISLTVKPKPCAPECPRKISLKDIFSDSMTVVNEPKGCSNIKINKNTVVNRADRIIPLKRTKICSSLDFDVSVMDTKMRNKGIKHLNQNIVVRLQELGVNNLLRASRPVKCGRKAVLNETVRKCLPYSASLTSLPLEDTDADIIDQSLNMSLNKTKHLRDHVNKLTYFTQLTSKASYKNNMQITFLQILRPNVRFPAIQCTENKFILKKLSFYINLVHDVENTYRKCIHEVRIFEVKRYKNNATLQNSTKSLQSNMIYRRPNRELNVNSSDQETPAVSLEELKVAASNAKRVVKKKLGQILKEHSVDNTTGSSSTIHSIPKEHFKNNSNAQSYNNASAQSECNRCSPTKKMKHFSCEKRKKNVSKIPVYKFIRHKNIAREENRECESDVYNINSKSLPKNENNIVEGPKVNSDAPPKCVDDRTPKMVVWKPEKNLLAKKNPQITKNAKVEPQSVKVNDKQIIRLDKCPEIKSDSKSSEDSFELYFNNYFYDTYFSRQALQNKQSSVRVLKRRRKKSEFLLSKSRSEIFVNVSKQNIGYLNIARSQIRKDERNGTLSKIRFNKLFDGDLKLSKSTLQYATKMVYEYLLKDSYLLENKDKILEVKDDVSGIFKNKCLDKILGGIKQKIVEGTIKDTPRSISQPDVEAGMDEEDVSIQIQVTRINSINQVINGDRLITSYFENHIRRHTFLPSSVTNEHSVQTISNRGISKCCQIPDTNVAEMENQLGTITDLPFIDCHNSCDHFDTFIVMFDSNSSTSLLSRDISSEDLIDDPIIYPLANECSVTRIKPFLNSEYGLVRKLMETSWQHMGLEPIEYFVYQNCNCMKSETFMEKLCAKSKSCFKSCRDRVIVKYKNNKCLRGSLEDYNVLICKKCGCNISPSPPKKKLDLTNYCSCTCPNQYKPYPGQYKAYQGQYESYPSQYKRSSRQHKPHSSHYEYYDDTTEPSESLNKHERSINRNNTIEDKHEKSVNSVLESSSLNSSNVTDPSGEILKTEKSFRMDQENHSKHEKPLKERSSILKSSSSQSSNDAHPHEETSKPEKSFRTCKCRTQERTERPAALCSCCKQNALPCKNVACHSSGKKHKVSCKTRVNHIKSQIDKSLKRLPCKSTKKVGNDFCPGRETKNVGVRCFPSSVNVGVCTQSNQPKKKNYICAHCSGKQNKGVDTKPSCKELGLQCSCPSQKDESSICNESTCKILSADENEAHTLHEEQHSISKDDSHKSETNRHSISNDGSHKSETTPQNISSNASHKSETDNTGFHSTVDGDIDDYLNTSTDANNSLDKDTEKTIVANPDES